MRHALAVSGLVAASATFAYAQEPYTNVVTKTAGMVGDAEARRLAAAHGLDIMNVTWEDTGRSKNSCIGPNISDMTIQVRDGERITCMPVIRFPNFSDKTGDVSLDKLQVLVGNERGVSLEPCSLREYLGKLRQHLSTPLSWKGERTSLLSDRDTDVLVSAQACFLPVPREGKAEFNPVLFNYQSYAGQPAVLAILATREGTSATIIDNQRDAWSWGQRIFFNQNGERAMLTGERLSDFADKVAADARKTGRPAIEPTAALSQVLLIQVPLKQAPRPRRDVLAFDGMDCKACCCAPGAKSDVEAAVIGHGKVEGPFVEIAGLPIERDESFPIRVTVQFYKATSNGAVSPKDMDEISSQIASVYKDASATGSLVTQGYTGRTTEHSGPAVADPIWWNDFWTRHEQTTGESRAESLAKLRGLVGGNWKPRDQAELETAIEIVHVRREKPESRMTQNPLPVTCTVPDETPVRTKVIYGAVVALMLSFCVVRARLG